jgi:hypothetical protein
VLMLLDTSDLCHASLFPAHTSTGHPRGCKLGDHALTAKAPAVCLDRASLSAKLS